MRRPSVSVCMATYNGARFLGEQIASVLPQLDENDELIVADDASRDGTVAILESLRDARMRILRQPRNAGVVKTFELALQEARGEIVFLCDQDDVWREDKVESVLAAFERSPEITLVLTNGELMDAQGRLLGVMLHDGAQLPLGLTANFIKNRYQGSAMAFRREILDAALPFPNRIPMHDSWIGLVNALVGKAVYLPQSLVNYRRHEKNATSRDHGPFLRMLAQRWRLLAAVIRRRRELAQTRRTLSRVRAA